MEGARPAVDADAARIDELRALAHDEMAAQRGGPLYVAREAVAAGKVEGRQSWVGTIDDVVVGFATSRSEILETGERHGIIDELFVEERARGVGVGEALMNNLLDWFREQRCASVDAIALPGDRETKNFFEGSGFTARLLIMHHRLS